MQILELTIYLRGRWGRNLSGEPYTEQRHALLASDLTACLLALDPSADPAPRVLQVEFPQGNWSYLYDEVNRPHFEDFMGSCRATVLLPMSCDLLGLEERLRPHLDERFLHISVREGVVGELARHGAVLKAGDAWLHSPAQAEALTGERLPAQPRFGPAEPESG